MKHHNAIRRAYAIDFPGVPRQILVANGYDSSAGGG
jgi:hypothetical protein